MAEIATLGLRLDGTQLTQAAGAAGRALDDLAEHGAKAETALDKIGKTAKVAFGVGSAAAAAFGALVLKESGEAEKVFAQLEARVKSTGAAAGLTATELRTMAGEMQRLTTFSDEAIQSMQGVLLTFTNVRGDTFTRTTRAVLDLATALGGDLEGNAIKLGKALQDPAQGLAMLSRSGVTFSDAQEQVIKSLAETNRLAEAQALILAEVERKVGGAAEAARGTFVGALAAVKNAFGDLLEVPSILAPITIGLNDLTKALESKALANAVKVMVQDTVFLLSAFAQAFAETAAFAVDLVGGFVKHFARLSGANSPLNKAVETAEQWRNSLIGASSYLEGLTDRIAAYEGVTIKAGTSTRGLAGGISATGVAATGTAVAIADLSRALSQSLGESLGDVESDAKRMWAALNPGSLDDLSAKLARLFPARHLSQMPGVDQGDPTSARTRFSPIVTPDELARQAQEAGERMQNAFSTAFQNIAARGKVAFGDLFNFAATLAKPGSAAAGAFGWAATFGASIAEAIFGNASRARAAREAFTRSVEEWNRSLDEWVTRFRLAGNAFAQALADIASHTASETQRLQEIFLTPTTRVRLREKGGDVDAAIASFSTEGIGPLFADQLRRYKAELDKLNATTEEAIRLTREKREREVQDLREDIQTRILRAQGRDGEADRAELAARHARERSAWMAQGLDILTFSLGLFAQAAEEAALVTRQAEEAERKRTELLKAQGDFARDLDIAVLAATGQDAAAERARLQVAQDERRARAQELYGDAIDAAVLATLGFLDAAEKAALAAQQARAQVDAWLETIQQQQGVFGLTDQEAFTSATEAFGFKGMTPDEIRALFTKWTPGEDLTPEQKEMNRRIAQWFQMFNNLPKDSPTDTVGPMVPTGAATRRGETVARSFTSASIEQTDRLIGYTSGIYIRVGRTNMLLERLTARGGFVGLVDDDVDANVSRQRARAGQTVVS